MVKRLCSWRIRRGDRGRAVAALAGGGAVLAASLGCGGSREIGGPEPAEAPGRAVTVFLDAAKRGDHAAMARTFGTAAGPIGDRGSAFGCGMRRVGSWIGLGRPCIAAGEIERRMDLMAGILAHESYRVGAASDVVGLGRPAARIVVEMDVGRGVVVVPFVVILTDDGSWLVEEVGLGGLVGPDGTQSASRSRPISSTAFALPGM